MDGSGAQSQSTTVFLENYLLIKSHGHELLDESLEMLASSLPQSKQSAEEYQNLILGWVACGWKCPVKGCTITLHLRSGKHASKIERDKDGHLEKLTVAPRIEMTASSITGSNITSQPAIPLI